MRVCCRKYTLWETTKYHCFVSHAKSRCGTRPKKTGKFKRDMNNDSNGIERPLNVRENQLFLKRVICVFRHVPPISPGIQSNSFVEYTSEL